VLSTLREATGSNMPLRGADLTVATRRTILGAPLFTSPAVPAGTVYGILADRVMVVMRDDVRLEVSREAYFSSDRVAVKATIRVGFAYPPAAVIKVALTAAPVVPLARRRRHPGGTMAAGPGIDGRRAGAPYPWQ
jgi:HK97 family phage major capsid protein